MTQERYISLMADFDSLTLEEIEQGWHFCPDWDGLLISPTCPEYESCTCP